MKRPDIFCITISDFDVDMYCYIISDYHDYNLCLLF